MNFHIEDNNEINVKVNQEENVGMRAGDTINIAVKDYNRLDNKPSISGVELSGALTLEDIGAASDEDLFSGDYNDLTNKPTLFSGNYNDLTNKPTIPVVPSNISAFRNDAGYITSESDPTVPSWAKQPTKPSYTASEVGALPSSTQIPSKTSDLTNDSGFLTSETDPTVPSWAKAQTKPTYTATEVGALPANTQIPSKTSDLTNDSNFTTKAYVDAQDDADRGRLYYGIVDATSTNVAFTAQISGITEYFDGLAVVLKNGVVTSAAGFTIDINGLGAKHAYSNMAAATAETTIFNVNYTMLFIYDSTRVEGGGWICYRGYNSDNNTIGYQIRTNSATLPLTEKTYRYRILFTSADGTHYVPANASTSTNATARRDVCQDPIDPFGRIVYYSSTSVIDANARPGAVALWDRYAIVLGYSFNRTGAALTMTPWEPVYVKCTPQANGSAIIDATTPFVQSLPNTEDGKIYIHLGVAYSATNIELSLEHPVYYYKDGAIRIWTHQKDTLSYDDAPILAELYSRHAGEGDIDDCADALDEGTLTYAAAINSIAQLML